MSQHINLYVYIFIPSLCILLSTSLMSQPSRYHRVPDWAPSVILQLPTSCLFYTWQCLCVDATLSICPTLFFPSHVHKSVLNTCISIPALQIGSSVLLNTLFLNRIYLQGTFPDLERNSLMMLPLLFFLSPSSLGLIIIQAYALQQRVASSLYFFNQYCHF